MTWITALAGRKQTPLLARWSGEGMLVRILRGDYIMGWGSGEGEGREEEGRGV